MPVTIAGYFLLIFANQHLVARVWLVAASLVFYSWWNPIYLPLLLISIVANFAVGTTLAGMSPEQDSRRRALLILGLLLNLGALAYYKYANFFVDNLNSTAGADLQIGGIALPLAISFYTFLQVAYLVDAYRYQVDKYDLLNYGLFVTYWPHLIAGPLVHHRELIPQFMDRANVYFNSTNFAVGLAVFAIGLFKKVIIADTFAVWAGQGFGSDATLSSVAAWISSLAYTFQLYFDFSGYVDMALGSALLLNIILPINFNSPYRSIGIQDFWRRWHITLSRFLRDYLYIPLGGSRSGEARTYINLFITFVLGGLWHGASWMFIIWGALHGTALCIERAWKHTKIQLPVWATWLITFVFVVITWVFFRAADMNSAMNVLTGMASVADGSFLLMFTVPQSFALTIAPEGNAFALVAVAAALALVLATPTTLQLCTMYSKSTPLFVFAGILFAVSILSLISGTARESEFLYFNF